MAAHLAGREGLRRAERGVLGYVGGIDRVDIELIGAVSCSIVVDDELGCRDPASIRLVEGLGETPLCP